MKFLVPSSFLFLASIASAQVGTVAEKTRIFPGSAGFVGPVSCRSTTTTRATVPA